MERKSQIHAVVLFLLGRNTGYKLDRRLLWPYSDSECCEEVNSLYLYWVRYPTPTHILYFYAKIQDLIYVFVMKVQAMSNFLSVIMSNFNKFFL